jgi:hypothetical protein
MRARVLVLFFLVLCLASWPSLVSAVPADRKEFLQRLVSAAIERTHHSVRYWCVH